MHITSETLDDALLALYPKLLSCESNVVASRKLSTPARSVASGKGPCAGLPELIDVLLPLRLEPKTDNGRLASSRTPTLFPYYNI